MNTRKDRLLEVYDHLRKYFGVHTKKDMAEAIDQTQPAMYSAFGGNEDYLTDKLFRRICGAYPGVFNLDYLLTGEGQLLTIEEEVKSKDIEKEHEIPEYMQRVFDQAASLAQRSEMLEQQLSLALADNRELKNNLKEALVAVDGMKQQMAMVLQIFNPQRNMSHFRENFVNDQAINGEP